MKIGKLLANLVASDFILCQRLIKLSSLCITSSAQDSLALPVGTSGLFFAGTTVSKVVWLKVGIRCIEGAAHSLISSVIEAV